MPQDTISPDVLQSLSDIKLNKYFFLAFYTILLYDHALTLKLEVETFWKKKKTLFLYLFIFTRYYTPLGLSVVAFAFFSPALDGNQCRHWSFFMPIAMTLGLMGLSGVLMSIRVYALWGKNKIILIALLSYLLAEMVTGIWSSVIRGATAETSPINNYDFHYCVFVAPFIDGRSSAYIYVFMDLGFNFVIFFLTVARTIYISHSGRMSGHAVIRNRSSSILENLVRDGAFYFGGILAMNLTWAIVILSARLGVRPVLAMPSSIVTIILVTRITLNLRLTVHGPAIITQRTVDGIPLTDMDVSRRNKNVQYQEQERSRSNVEGEFVA